jgi:hypothetical protein
LPSPSPVRGYLAVAVAFATDVLPDRSDVGKDLLAEPMP